ncbi:MAG: hypothetical protein ACI9BO_002644 [Zhongshania sp.]|jgi:hypothetical protein
MKFLDYKLAENAVAEAAGKYLYFKNDELQPIVETWQQYRNTVGEKIIHSTRQLDGVFRLTSQALVSASLFTQVSMQWQSEHTVDAVYDTDNKQCYHQLDAGKSMSLALPDAPIYPLMRVYTGALIKHISRLGGEADIVIPDIRPNNSANEKLLPLLSTRRCEFHGNEEIILAGEKLACERWSFIGDQYSSDSEFWLSAEGLLLRYCWPQDDISNWRVELVQDI